MIYDEQTKRWYINEFHLEQCRRARESNERLKKRLPLSHKEVLAQAECWNANNALIDLIDCLKASNVSKEDSQVICLSLKGYPQIMDELSLYIIKNRPSLDLIMEKMLELVETIHPMNQK